VVRTLRQAGADFGGCGSDLGRVSRVCAELRTQRLRGEG
jgi:hypothetical protein